jgi:protein-disulfide isomerase-like protein with CxxC motif
MDNNPLMVADFWFDPICPWAWLASRWMIEVEQVRPVDVRWRVMSLAMLNEGREMPPEYVDLMRRAWIPVRVIVAAQLAHGDEVVLPMYEAMGRRIHLDSRDDFEEVCGEAVAELGLPASLGDTSLTDHVDAELRTSHERAMSMVGLEVGTPVIAVPGPDGEPTAIFGPVVSPAPKGEDAGRLWDGTLLVMSTPGFFELKRSRTVGPIFD